MVQQNVLPAEWQHQAAILLTWPHAHSDWLPWLAPVEQTFVALAVEISKREGLIISCYDSAHQRHVAALLNAAGASSNAVKLYRVASNDSWARDHGPISVYRDGRPLLLNFRFNGWGGKFRWELDDQITFKLHDLGAFGSTPLETMDLILEGGSIESDGQGTLLTTRQCLLAPNRNGKLAQGDLEQALRSFLGTHRFLWLNNGQLLGDDTDGHIDTLARFCNPHTIAYQSCDDTGDPHFGPLKAMAAELQAFRTATGTPYRLVPLPLPRPRFNDNGERLPAGYANFTIINNAVLVPIYDDPADDIALQRLRGCFLDRAVIGINCASLIQQGGSLHCVTMQLPAGVVEDFV